MSEEVLFKYTEVRIQVLSVMESGLYGISLARGKGQGKGTRPRLVSQTVFARTGLGTRPDQTLPSLSLVTGRDDSDVQ